MREFKGKLSEDDLVYLRSRHSDAYVDRMVELHGLKSGVDADEAPAEEPEDAPETDEEAEGDPEATEDGDEAEDGDEDDEEDLIGDTSETSYDPLSYTTNEVRAYMKDANPEERERVRQVESARDDREPRKSIVEYDPS